MNLGIKLTGAHNAPNDGYFLSGGAGLFQRA